MEPSIEKTIAVVMAAGKGTRMKSDLPKVLVPVCGRPMIHYVLDALESCGVRHSVVVVGHRGDLVREELADRAGVEFAEQTEQLGTAHAVMCCRQQLEGHQGAVVVLAGDSPMIRPASLAALLEEFARSRPACILGTCHKDDPTGLGRIVRDADGGFAGIVEEKDADDLQRQITEVNMSYYVFDCRDLLESLEHVETNNVQGEYYVTDCPGILLGLGRRVLALDVLQPEESLSINSPQDLAAVEAAMRACE